MKKELKQNNKIPFATHEGEIEINGFKIKSYNLNTGERVLSRIDFLRALGRTGKAKGGRQYDKEFDLPIFLTANNLKDFIGKELQENSTPIIFKDLKGLESIGYKAELLPTVCYVFIDANESKKLLKTQLHILEQCKMLVRGFATVGIVALIDEATGYQYDREKDALKMFLEKFLLKEQAKWIKTFPDEFFEVIFKMKKWNWIGMAKSKKPSVIGHYINNFVYSRLAPDVLTILKNKNPIVKNPITKKGHRESKHTQFINADYGHPLLKEHLSALIALGKASGYSWRNFQRLVNRAFPKFGETLSLGFEDDDIID
jgi:hypothetical protein